MERRKNLGASALVDILCIPFVIAYAIRHAQEELYLAYSRARGAISERMNPVPPGCKRYYRGTFASEEIIQNGGDKLLTIEERERRVAVGIVQREGMIYRSGRKEEPSFLNPFGRIRRGRHATYRDVRMAERN